MAGIDLGRFKGKKNDDWLDWLADDPVPASLRARMRSKAVQEASRPVVRRVGEQQANQPVTATKKSQNPSVSIHISIPKFNDIKLPKIPKLQRKQLIIGGSSLAAVVVIATVGLIAIPKLHNKPTNSPTGVLSAKDIKPDFAYSLPKATKTGATVETRYDAKRKVVSFKDSIGGVEITVSQQPMPENLKKNTDEGVKKLAEGFSANDVLSTANPTAYLGTDAKGPQTVIFVKKDLLVFIFSVGSIDKHDWSEYITNLE